MTIATLSKILVFAVLATLGIAFISYYGGIPGWDFQNNLWGPAHLLINGKSPFDLWEILPEGRALWAPPVVGAFFLVGLLPLQQASNLWLLVNITSLFLILIISDPIRKANKGLFILIFAMIIIFPPVVSTLLLGQISIVVTMFFLASGRALESGRQVAAAALIVLATAKPQLAFLPVAGLFFYIARSRGIRQLIQYIILVIIISLLLVIPIFSFYPQWMPDYLSSLIENPAWIQPTLRYQLVDNFGNIGLMLWTSVFFLSLYATIRIWSVFEPQKAMARSLALTILASPYMWSYDFVLALPLVIEMFYGLSSFFLRIVYSFVFVSISGAMIAMNIFNQGDNSIYWSVPIAMWVMLLLAAWAETRSSGKNLLWEMSEIQPLVEKMS